MRNVLFSTLFQRFSNTAQLIAIVIVIAILRIILTAIVVLTIKYLTFFIYIASLYNFILEIHQDEFRSKLCTEKH